MKTDFMQTVNLLTIELQLRVEGSNNLLSLYLFSLKPALKASSDVRYSGYYAPINVKPVWGGGGGSRAWGWGFDIFQKFGVKLPAHGQIILVNCNQISPPRAAHCCYKCPKAEPKKGTIKISPNKTLQSLFTLRCCITKDTCSCYSCNYTF